LLEKIKKRNLSVGYIPTTKKIVLGVNELHFIEGIPLSFFFFFLILSLILLEKAYQAMGTGL
jgi:hypothetical protein